MIASISFALVFLLYIRFSPYKVPYAFFVKHAEASKVNYQNLQLYVFILLLILVPSMTYLFAAFFSGIYNILFLSSPGLIYQLGPNKLMWYIPSVLLSLAVVVYPVIILYKLILKDRYYNYFLRTHIKYGFDIIQLYKPIAWLFVLIAGIMLIFMLDYSTEIYNDKIVLNDFFRMSKKTYQLKEIRAIIFVKNIKSSEGLDPKPHYVIQFADKGSWSTLSGLNDKNKQTEIINFLVLKSQKQIKTLRFDPE